jgi:NAD(P)H-hydrate repair Nnr-like enzyme with NAD(P)H-hydrate dehydratase domain
MWPGLGSEIRRPAGRGFVLAALCAGLLAARQEEGTMTTAETAAAAAVTRQIDAMTFEMGWDRAATYPRGE